MIEPRTCYNLTFISEDKLARGPLIEGNSISILIPTIFLVLSPIPITDLMDICMNANLQKTIRLALESFIQSQDHGHL